jgi:hypothetical protein
MNSSAAAGSRLPNSKTPPSGRNAVVMAMFDVTVPRTVQVCVPRELRKMLASLNASLSVDELQASLEQLVQDDLIERTECPPPRYPPVVYHIDPGIPPVQTHGMKIRGEPEPGDECFRATPLGAKAARMCRDILWGVSGSVGWLLGHDRLADQVLLASNDTVYSVTLKHVDACCCCDSTEAVRAAISQNIADGLMIDKHGETWTLTHDGEQRKVELQSELRALTMPPCVTPMLPSDADCVSLLAQLSEEQLVPPRRFDDPFRPARASGQS